MGNEEHGENEKPVHAVYLDSYWIDQTEVTNTMYAHFLNIMGNQSSESGIPWLDASDNDVKIHQSNNIWQVDSEYENHPVIEVSWYGAQAYCEWAGRRLPTEAEWEKAAGWDDDLQSQQIFPWGDSFDAGGANFCDSNCPTGWRNENYDDGYQYTSPVGSYESGQSFYGAYDMAGNVWELVEDWYDAYQGNTVDDSDYGTTYKVLRGGSWDLTEYYLRPAFRVKSSPADADYDIGFRCVFSASE